MGKLNKPIHERKYGIHSIKDKKKFQDELIAGINIESQIIQAYELGRKENGRLVPKERYERSLLSVNQMMYMMNLVHHDIKTMKQPTPKEPIASDTQTKNDNTKK